MTLAYSALSTNTSQPGIQQQSKNVSDYVIKHLAYQAACAKYSDHIQAIQKFFPGWLPGPPVR